MRFLLADTEERLFLCLLLKLGLKVVKQQSVKELKTKEIPRKSWKCLFITWNVGNLWPKWCFQQFNLYVTWSWFLTKHICSVTENLICCQNFQNFCPIHIKWGSRFVQWSNRDQDLLLPWAYFGWTFLNDSLIQRVDGLRHVSPVLFVSNISKLKGKSC